MNLQLLNDLIRFALPFDLPINNALPFALIRFFKFIILPPKLVGLFEYLSVVPKFNYVSFTSKTLKS